jgi:hypothetical protein
MTSRKTGGGGLNDDFNIDGGLIGYRVSPNCGAWEMRGGCDSLTTQTDATSFLVPFDTTQITSKTNRSQPKGGDPCHPLAAQGHAPAVVSILAQNGSDIQISSVPGAITAGISRGTSGDLLVVTGYCQGHRLEEHV